MAHAQPLRPESEAHACDVPQPASPHLYFVPLATQRLPSLNVLPLSPTEPSLLSVSCRYRWLVMKNASPAQASLFAQHVILSCSPQPALASRRVTVTSEPEMCVLNQSSYVSEPPQTCLSTTSGHMQWLPQDTVLLRGPPALFPTSIVTHCPLL